MFDAYIINKDQGTIGVSQMVIANGRQAEARTMWLSVHHYSFNNMHPQSNLGLGACDMLFALLWHLAYCDCASGNVGKIVF